MKKFLAYLGHINIDIIFRVPKLVSSGSVPIEDERKVFGGTLGNFALIASRFALDFDPYAAVSSETHSEYLKLLESRGLNLEHVKVFQDTRGPFCYIASDRNNQLAFINQGPNLVWKPSRESSLIDGYKILHFTTGPRDEYLKIARQSHSVIVFDPSQEIYLYSKNELSEFISLSDIVMCNEEEYELIKENLNDNDSPTIIKTMGSRGVEVFDKGNKVSVKARKVEGHYDTVGAGDAFRAGFYSAYLKYNDIPKAVMYGNIVASEVIRLPVIDFDEPWSKIESIYSKGIN
ncbi:MAG: carbohydrate kinase family protein [Candidatus Thermoplasmatota archaeon]|nr:carbohydrate kinase family protein [Candidatus Thermoplasmatota archaeon]